jgi:hypothetical protein
MMADITGLRNEQASRLSISLWRRTNSPMLFEFVIANVLVITVWWVSAKIFDGIIGVTIGAYECAVSLTASAQSRVRAAERAKIWEARIEIAAH